MENVNYSSTLDSWEQLLTWVKSYLGFLFGEGKAFGHYNLTMFYLGRHFSIPSPKLFTAEGGRSTMTQEGSGAQEGWHKVGLKAQNLSHWESESCRVLGSRALKSAAQAETLAWQLLWKPSWASHVALVLIKFSSSLNWGIHMCYMHIIMQCQVNGYITQMIKSLCWYKAQVRES